MREGREVDVWRGGKWMYGREGGGCVIGDERHAWRTQFD